MNFVACSVSPMRSGKGRGAPSPQGVPAPFYSALVRMIELGGDNEHQSEALRMARKYCAQSELVGLQLALSVARIQAQTVIAQIDDIAALFPQPDIDSSTQMYGE